MGALIRIWYSTLLVLIITLFVYSNVCEMYMDEHEFSLENYLKNPQKYGNYKAKHFGKIINISQDHFYYNVGELSIRVEGSGVKKAVYGETTLFINHRKDGIIELIDYHNYNYNYVLYVLSLLAFIIFLIIFLKEWKITPGGFEDA